MAWVPLESNPDVMTKFLHIVGVPKKWSLIDVYGTDPDLLAVVPRPVLALILLYPISEKTEKFKDELEAKVKENEQTISENVYHMKQCVSNACGTVALIHSVANNEKEIQLDDGILKTFLDASRDLPFEKRGELLLATTQSIMTTHKELAQEGQTEVPGEDTPVNHHFVALIHKDGSLYELDGRKSVPINHGPTSPDRFLEDAARVCRDYMSRDPEEVRFTMMALTATD